MKLDEFICASPLGITKGLKDANTTLGGTTRAFAMGASPLVSKEARVIEFDVAVTARSEKDAQGGVEVFGVGLGGSVSTANEQVSRIRFKVDLGHLIT